MSNPMQSLLDAEWGKSVALIVASSVIISMFVISSLKTKVAYKSFFAFANATNAGATVALIVSAWLIIELLGNSSMAYAQGIDTDGDMTHIGEPNVLDVRRINMTVGIILLLAWLVSTGLWAKFIDNIPGKSGEMISQVLPLGLNFGRKRRR